MKRVGRRGRDAWDDLKDELVRARRQLVRARRRSKLADEAEDIGS
jgi:hypothetical protein